MDAAEYKPVVLGFIFLNKIREPLFTRQELKTVSEELVGLGYDK